MFLKKVIGSNVFNSFVYSNIVSNGNFESTTGWSATAATLTSVDNSLLIRGNGTSATAIGFQTTSTDIAAGKKYFISGLCRVTNSNATSLSIRFNGSTSGTLTVIGSQTNPVLNQLYKLSGIATITDQTGKMVVYFRNSYTDAATANNKVLEAKECLCVDLTSLYGAGNEPSAADCANIFKFVDGTKQPNFSTQLAT